jgi:predicted Fe-Mo cluster-binding NifX family protein
MRVAVTATGPTREADVDPRFGRCRHFVFVDTDGDDCEAVENRNAGLGGGAGIQSAQLVAEKGAEAVLTGNCGPNAFQVLAAAGVSVFTGVGGTVEEAVQSLRNGELTPARRANVTSHHGMQNAT